MKKAFGGCFSEYCHIYIDMPGFGVSENENALQTADYKAILQLFLESIGKNPKMILGHSFGGKVATLLAPPHLVLLGSAGIKTEKSLKTKTKIQAAKLLKPLLGGSVRKLFASSDAKDMNEGMYQTFKNVVDEDFSDAFAAFEGDCAIFWGRDDTATPLASGQKIASLIKGSKFHILEGDHYFFLDKGKDIEKLL